MKLHLNSQDAYISDLILHDFVDRIGKELVDTSDTVDPFTKNDDTPVRYSLLSEALKNIDSDESDYEGLVDDHPIPSIRDNEQLHHSTLWSYNVDAGKPLKPIYNTRVKNEASLPAYCNPPNPCPVGYTEDQQCQTDFENTSAFSREYQAAQECMCDNEHMFDCPSKEADNGAMDENVKMLLSKQFGLFSTNQKNMVAKKYEQHQVCV